jgi:hypothetical protein
MFILDLIIRESILKEGNLSRGMANGKKTTTQKSGIKAFQVVRGQPMQKS